MRKRINWMTIKISLKNNAPWFGVSAKQPSSITKDLCTHMHAHTGSPFLLASKVS